MFNVRKHIGKLVIPEMVLNLASAQPTSAVSMSGVLRV